MKKFLGLLVFAMVLNSCDDGEIEIQSFDFSDVQAQNCGNTIYKLNENEALYFQIPYETSFVNDATLPGVPRVVNIDGTVNHRIYYRAYDGEVGTANICETFQPSTPQITEEWQAVSGSIQISTIPVIVANTDTDFPGGEKIIRYKHTITFVGVEYNNGQVDPSLTFGTYDTTPTTLPFNFDTAVDKCDSSNLIYNFNGSEAITLNIDPDLIPSEITPVGTPRTGTISSTENVVTYKLFNGLVLAPYFCTTPIPATPGVIQQWNAINGTIEVITTTSGTGFLHEIHLKNVTLKQGNSSFLLATDYKLGDLLTN